jgi:hypothetical protein
MFHKYIAARMLNEWFEPQGKQGTFCICLLSMSVTYGGAAQKTRVERRDLDRRILIAHLQVHRTKIWVAIGYTCRAHSTILHYSDSSTGWEQFSSSNGVYGCGE